MPVRTLFVTLVGAAVVVLSPVVAYVWDEGGSGSKYDREWSQSGSRSWEQVYEDGDALSFDDQFGGGSTNDPDDLLGDHDGREEPVERVGNDGIVRCAIPGSSFYYVCGEADDNEPDDPPPSLSCPMLPESQWNRTVETPAPTFDGLRVSARTPD